MKKRRRSHLASVRCFRPIGRPYERRRERPCKFIQECRGRTRTEELLRRKSRGVLQPKFQRFRESVYRAYFHGDVKPPSPPPLGIFRHGASQYRVVMPASVPFLISPRTIRNPWPPLPPFLPVLHTSRFNSGSCSDVSRDIRVEIRQRERNSLTFIRHCLSASLKFSCEEIIFYRYT